MASVAITDAFFLFNKSNTTVKVGSGEHNVAAMTKKVLDLIPNHVVNYTASEEDCVRLCLVLIRICPAVRNGIIRRRHRLRICPTIRSHVAANRSRCQKPGGLAAENRVWHDVTRTFV